MEEDKKDRLSAKEFFQLSELWGYFFRKKAKDPNADFGLKAMHFVNKLAIAIFLLGVLYLIIKNIF